MSEIYNSIQKARDNGFNDDDILKEIQTQSPEKAPTIQKALSSGAKSIDILNEIQKQNAPVEFGTVKSLGEDLSKRGSAIKQQFTQNIEATKIADPKNKETMVKKALEIINKKTPEELTKFGITDEASKLAVAENQVALMQDEAKKKLSVGGDIKSGLRVAGQLAGGLNDIIGQGIGAIAKTATEVIPDPIKNALMERIKESPATQVALKVFTAANQTWQEFEKSNPETAQTLKDIGNIASFIPLEKLVIEGAKSIGSGIIKTVDVATDVIKKAPGIVDDLSKTVQKVAPKFDATEAIQVKTSKIQQTIDELKAKTSTLTDEKQISKNVNEITKQENLLAKEQTKKIKMYSPIVKEAINSGLDEPTVTFVSGLTTADKNKGRQMIDIAEKAKTDKTFSGNPKDIAGKSVIDRVSIIEKAKKEADKKMDEALESMPNKLNDITKSRTSFITNLKGADVKIKPNGELSFGRSTIVDPAVQKVINEAYKRTVTGKMTPQSIRSFRSRIRALETKINSKILDKRNQDYGIVVLEKLRKDLSSDIGSEVYQKYAKQYAKTSSALEDLYKSLGKAGENFTDAEYKSLKAGELVRRMLSNASADPKELMNNIDDIAKEYGYNVGDNLYNQAVLANEIEKLYKITPETSFGGQIKTAVEGATAVGDVAKVAAGDISKIPGIMEKAKGVFGKGEEAKKTSFKKLLIQNTQNLMQ
jgi:FtsZ-binding cell division protein ZapB